MQVSEMPKISVDGLLKDQSTEVKIEIKCVWDHGERKSFEVRYIYQSTVILRMEVSNEFTNELLIPTTLQLKINGGPKKKIQGY